MGVFYYNHIFTTKTNKLKHSFSLLSVVQSDAEQPKLFQHQEGGTAAFWLRHCGDFKFLLTTVCRIQLDLEQTFTLYLQRQHLLSFGSLSEAEGLTTIQNRPGWAWMQSQQHGVIMPQGIMGLNYRRSRHSSSYMGTRDCVLPRLPSVPSLTCCFCRRGEDEVREQEQPWSSVNGVSH